MGQQQLLLVILVTIIVGIATVVAINTFGAAADSANVDAVRQDVATIAAAAQGYFMKPQMLGGGGRTFTDIEFTDFAFAALDIDNTGLIAWNENGKYVIAPTAANIAVVAHPASRIDGAIVAGTTPDDADETLAATITQDNLTWD